MGVTAKDLRYRTSEVLDRVARGERIVVTRRGKPKALLVPADAAAGPEQEADPNAFGIWRDHRKIVNAKKWLKKIRTPRYR